MSSSPRVMLLGLDAFDARLALELSREGRLPNLSALLAAGAWAPTVTPPGLVVGAIWPSITTGCWPSRHGFYSDLQLTVGTYEARKAGPWEITQPRFWDAATHAGLRCAVLDVPLASAADVNGVHLVEWGAHDRFERCRARRPSSPSR